MSAPTDVRTQLRSLAIPKENRPAVRAARSGGSGLLRMLGVLIVLASLAVAGYASRDKLRALFSGSAGSEPVPLLTVQAAEAATPPPVLTATGKIVSDHQVEVATKVSGQIVSLHFEQGDRIKEGQLLARIEDVLYKALRDEAAARLQQARANLEYQRFNFERISRLYQTDKSVDNEYADARRWLAEAEAQVEAGVAALAAAQKALDDTQVTAPISGVILERSVEVGDFVAAEGGRGAMANAQFATVADMSKLRVEVDISELDIDRIHKDMRCVVTPDAYKDRTYDGYVLWIDPGANYSKGTVQAKVRIENPDEYLRIEGSAQVVFVPDEEPSERQAEGTPTGQTSLWIPSGACLLDDTGRQGTVFRAVDGRLHRTSVTIGRTSGGQVEVLSGLSPGDQVAASGVDTLTDGQWLP